MATIDIPWFEVLRGSYDISGAETVNGPGFFAPHEFADDGNATINAAVLGGTFTAGTYSGEYVNSGTLTFTNFVAPGVTADLLPESIITVDHPREFFGTIGFVAPEEYSAPAGEYVDLVGLAKADEYSLKNDLVTVRAANGRPLDVLRVSSNVANSLQIPGSTTMLIADAGNVYLTLGYGFDRIPGGFSAGTVLHPVST